MITPESTVANSREAIIKRLADAICMNEWFAVDAGNKVYRYSGGTYRSRGETYIKKSVKRLLIEWQLTEEWSPKIAENVIEWIRLDLPQLWDQPPTDVVNVANGLLNVTTRQLTPHSPDFLSPVQLNVTFDPNATCPHIEQFVREVFPADAGSTPWEIVGWLIVPDRNLQKAVLLTGDGLNGKSTWLTLTQTFLGSQNVSNLSLHEIEGDKFAAVRLVGKLANICSDLPASHLSSSSIFKKLTGDDHVSVQHKYGIPFDVKPFSRLLFSANHPPRSSDASDAFFRRWLVIPFDRVISNPIPAETMKARLHSPAELSGLLNKALDGLAIIKAQNGFSEPESIKQAHREFQSSTDPFAVWLEKYTIDDPDGSVAKKTLRASYAAECERRGQPAMTDAAFTRTLKKLRPKVEAKQRRAESGQREWCFVGLAYIHDKVTQTTQLVD